MLGNIQRLDSVRFRFWGRPTLPPKSDILGVGWPWLLHSESTGCPLLPTDSGPFVVSLRELGQLRGRDIAICTQSGQQHLP